MHRALGLYRRGWRLAFTPTLVGASRRSVPGRPARQGWEDLAEIFPCFPQISGVVFHTPYNLLYVLITTPTAMQGLRCFVSPSLQTPSYSRRHTSRVEMPDGVWVCWRCNDRNDVSRVRDLSAAGLFIATPVPQPMGMKAKLDFLVEEGQIRAEAIVRHVQPGLHLPRLDLLVNWILHPEPPAVG